MVFILGSGQKVSNKPRFSLWIQNSAKKIKIKRKEKLKAK